MAFHYLQTLNRARESLDTDIWGKVIAENVLGRSGYNPLFDKHACHSVS